VLGSALAARSLRTNVFAERSKTICTARPCRSAKSRLEASKERSWSTASCARAFERLWLNVSAADEASNDNSNTATISSINVKAEYAWHGRPARGIDKHIRAGRPCHNLFCVPVNWIVRCIKANRLFLFQLDHVNIPVGDVGIGTAATFAAIGAVTNNVVRAGFSRRDVLVWPAPWVIL